MRIAPPEAGGASLEIRQRLRVLKHHWTWRLRSFSGSWRWGMLLNPNGPNEYKY